MLPQRDFDDGCHDDLEYLCPISRCFADVWLIVLRFSDLSDRCKASLVYNDGPVAILICWQCNVDDLDQMSSLIS